MLVSLAGVDYVPKVAQVVLIKWLGCLRWHEESGNPVLEILLGAMEFIRIHPVDFAKLEEHPVGERGNEVGSRLLIGGVREPDTGISGGRLEQASAEVLICICQNWMQWARQPARLVTEFQRRVVDITALNFDVIHQDVTGRQSMSPDGIHKQLCLLSS